MSSNSVVILDNVSLDLPEDVIAELTKGLGQVDGMVLETNHETTVTPAATPAADNDDSWFRAGPSSRPGATPGRLSSGKNMKTTAAAATPVAAATTPVAAATPAADNDDSCFRAGPSLRPGATPGRLSSGKKNMKTLLKSLRSLSPTPSRVSTQSSTSSAEEEEEGSIEILKYLEEEQRRRRAEEERRAEWTRRSAGQKGAAERNLLKARGVLASLAGERKVVRNQREALIAQHRAQMRALDDQDLSIDKREHSALRSVKLHERIAAKYKEMNI